MFSKYQHQQTFLEFISPITITLQQPQPQSMINFSLQSAQPSRKHQSLHSPFPFHIHQLIILNHANNTQLANL